MTSATFLNISLVLTKIACRKFGYTTFEMLDKSYIIEDKSNLNRGCKQWYKTRVCMAAIAAAPGAVQGM